DAPVFECWSVAADVEAGRDADLRWASGAGWLFAALEVDGEACAAAQYAYERLGAFLLARPPCHVLRLWNYLGDINHGDNDDERYKAFCVGRARGMGELFAEGYPAATAIGHRSESDRLQVYCLASAVAGERVENPRQISAWRYPRQYGPTPPSFARAMLTPKRDALAISGTASIVGHQSQHGDDLNAQLDETLANIQALLLSADLNGGLDQRALLKIYVRHSEHVAAVQAYLDTHAPQSQRLLLLGDICRRELLVEIDGWRYT
ncbi:MAG: pteridine-dependent deoxygenase, partial [Xanthomonadales bacterium]|nr:pteridine-dependent deoxygenase [Xanthomonadales bacterium]